MEILRGTLPLGTETPEAAAAPRDRQRHIKAGLAAGTLLLSGCIPSSAAPFETADTHLSEAQAIAHHNVVHGPNIVLVETDDESLNLMPYMPFTSRYFRNHGVKFTNSIVAQSLCCSSRTTKYTGEMPHNSGVMTNKYPDGGFLVFHKRDEASTFPVWLQRAGYYTAFWGKFMNQYPGSGRQVPKQLRLPRNYIPKGFDYFVSAAKGSPYKERGERLNVNGRVDAHKRHEYLVRTLDHMATRFLRGRAKQVAPYEAEIDTYAPHSPYTDEKRFSASHYRAIDYPRTPAFNEANVSDKTNIISQLPLESPSEIRKTEYYFRKRIGAVMSVDRMFKHVIDTLRHTHQLKNTYVIFTSDNGLHMGEHRLGIGKNTPYEPDIRVPLYVSGPGIRGGRIIHKLVSNTDLAPTIAAMAGVKPPAGLDGRSFLPLLRHKKHVPWRTYALTERGPDEYYVKNAKSVQEPADPMDFLSGAGDQETEPYVAVRWVGRRPGLYVEYNDGNREYYDLSTDPYEDHNLLGPHARMNRAQQHQLALAKAALDQLKHCRGNAGPDSCFITRHDAEKLLANR